MSPISSPISQGVLAVLCVASLTAAPAMAKTKAKPAPATSSSAIQEVEKAAGHKVVLGDKVQFVTAKGKFTVVLFPKEAPKTVANFEKLVKKGFYNGLVFHRVIPGFVAQGGDPKGTGEGGPGYTIPDELKSTLKHVRGSLAMAKTMAPNSAGSQFYVAYAPLPNLDGRYTVFGQVIEGMDVVDKLQPIENGASPDGKRVSPDKMLKVTVLK